MSETFKVEDPLPADLPSVQPPSASFFVQLFLLPSLIVAGIAAVWFLFGWLAGGERTIQEYLAVIRSNRGDRWQAAHDLSRLLHVESAYTRDPELARTLAAELETALAEPDRNDRNKYLEYLVGALSTFHVPDGASALRHAADPQHDPAVRRAAIIALARYADRMADLEDPQILPTARSSLRDSDTQIREASALLLGKLDDARAVDDLAKALHDPAASVRYNAAIALGNLGSTAGLTAYPEMLNPAMVSQNLANDEGIADRVLVVATVRAAVGAVAKVRDAHPQLDLSHLLPAVEELIRCDDPLLRHDAADLFYKLDRSAIRRQGDRR